MKQGFSIFIVVTLIFLTTTVSEGQINYGLIPQACQVDWTNAGLLPGTSFQAVDVYDVNDYGAIPNDGQNDYSAIMAAINAAQSAAGLSVVYFPTGTYNINSTISLSRASSSMGYSNIVLQGAGSDRTILQFTVGSTNDCINVYGVEASSNVYALTNVVAKGSTLLTRSDLSMFSVNDWVHLCEENFPYGGSDPRFVGQITQLSTVGTGQATMKDEASKEYRPEYNLWIQKLYPIMNVGIENLKIYRADESPVIEGGANIKFNIAVNCWVRGVESDNTTYNHLAIDRCSHIEISGNYIHHARSYGIYDPPADVHGTGYGMVIGTSSTNCLIVNNVWHKLRHAMTVGTGANCNVFVYNYSREQTSPELQVLGDICLHGRYPYANLFEQNVVCQISADNTHHKNGPYNAFLRNWVVIPPFEELKIHGPIWLYDAPNTAVLGCETWMGPGHNPISADGNTSLSVDFYGYFNGAYRSHEYMTAHESFIRLNASALGDVTYYYSSRPDFLDMRYTWPSLGPVYATSCTQIIPAEDRYFDSSVKTYLPNPTLKPLTTSGTLLNDEIWPNGHTLTGNVTVPDNIILFIANGATINLNGYYVKCQGSGQIIKQGSATFSPYDISIKSGTVIKGRYPSLNAAFANVVSGQAIVVGGGSYTVSNNLTVASGVALQINAGTTLSFTGNYKLRIEGTLTAVGTYTNKITFTRSGGTWYGIEFWNGAFGSEIWWANINNAQYGVRMYNTNVVLSDNSVKYNTIGLRFENQSDGVGIIRGNVVAENNDKGVECVQYSDPLLFSSNVIRYNNFYGVYGDNTSAPDLGRYSDQGHNSIYYNGDDVWSTYGGTIYALYNWWGEYPAYPIVSYNVDYSNALSYDPNPGMGKAAANALSFEKSNRPLKGNLAADTLGITELNQAYQVFLDGKLEQALALFEGIVQKYPEHFSGRRALAFMDRTLGKLNQKTESLSRLNTIAAAHPNLEIAGLANSITVGHLIKNAQYTDAATKSQAILNGFPKTTLAKYALYDLGSLYWYRLEDQKTGETYFRQLIAEWPEDDLSISALATLGEWKPKSVQGGEAILAKAQGIPTAYALAQNFPNPFNPQTLIQYQLPEASHLTLKIYNLFGQEIRTLFDGQQRGGLSFGNLEWPG